MHVNNTKIFNTTNIEAGVFFLMGGAKTVNDYRSVGDDYKQRILLNDVVVLSTSCLGMLGYQKLAQGQMMREKFFKPIVNYGHMQFQRFRKTDFAKNYLIGRFNNLYHPLQAPIEHSKNIIGGCVSNVLMVASGLFSAILGDYVLTKTGFGIHKLKNIMDNDPSKIKKQVNEVEKFMKKNADAVIGNKQVRREMTSRITDMPIFKYFTSALVGLQGLKITDDENHSKQIKNARKYLMLNSLVPLFFLSLSSDLTTKLKNIYRFPIMFTSLVAGTYIVKNFVDKNVNKSS